MEEPNLLHRILVGILILVLLSVIGMGVIAVFKSAPLWFLLMVIIIILLFKK